MRKQKSASSKGWNMVLQILTGHLDRIDARILAMETQQSLIAQAFQQQGTAIETIDKRCLTVLSASCPLLNEGQINGDVATISEA